jgi:hypothetical protein
VGGTWVPPTLMVSWKGAGVVVAALAVLVGYLVLSRPRPAPQTPALIPCGQLNTDYLRIQGGGRTLEIERSSPSAPWELLQPVAAPGDADTVGLLVNQLNSVQVLNTISSPKPRDQYGLTAPSLAVTCRVNGGRSYNLTVGNQSFDGSGYYAQKGGDNRVLVISKVEVDGFERALAAPPVKASPSPQ